MKNCMIFRLLPCFAFFVQGLRYKKIDNKLVCIVFKATNKRSFYRTWIPVEFTIQSPLQRRLRAEVKGCLPPETLKPLTLPPSKFSNIH